MMDQPSDNSKQHLNIRPQYTAENDACENCKERRPGTTFRVWACHRWTDKQFLGESHKSDGTYSWTEKTYQVNTEYEDFTEYVVYLCNHCGDDAETQRRRWDLQFASGTPIMLCSALAVVFVIYGFVFESFQLAIYSSFVLVPSALVGTWLTWWHFMRREYPWWEREIRAGVAATASQRRIAAEKPGPRDSYQRRGTHDVFVMTETVRKELAINNQERGQQCYACGIRSATEMVCSGCGFVPWELVGAAGITAATLLPLVFLVYWLVDHPTWRSVLVWAGSIVGGSALFVFLGSMIAALLPRSTRS